MAVDLDLQVLKVELEMILYFHLLHQQVVEKAQEASHLQPVVKADLAAEAVIQVVEEEVEILHLYLHLKEQTAELQVLTVEAVAVALLTLVIMVQELMVDPVAEELLQILQVVQWDMLAVAAGELMEQQAALQVTVEDQEVLMHLHRVVKAEQIKAAAVAAAEELLEDQMAEAVDLVK